MTQDKVCFSDTAHRVSDTGTRRRFQSFALAVTLPFASCSAEAIPLILLGQKTEPAIGRKGDMKITVRIGEKTLYGSLRDTATGRDFLSMLPLVLDLKDYASTEKISDLPRRLNTAGAPAGADPSIGDIAYYAPWGNLAIYYRDSGYAKGLVILGKIDGGLEALTATGPGKATLELAPP